MNPTTGTIPRSTSLAVDHLFDFHIEFSETQFIPSPFGLRVVTVVAGGRLDGPRLSGRVLGGGGDWLVIGTDGAARVDVRATLVPTNGDHVLMTSTGRVVVDDDTRARYLAGETLDAGDMYARTAPLFETASTEFGWLNQAVTVGVVVGLSIGHIDYEVYEVR